MVVKKKKVGGGVGGLCTGVPLVAIAISLHSREWAYEVWKRMKLRSRFYLP